MMCRKCRQTKLLDEFGLTPAGNPRRVCKKCMAAAQMARYEANKDEHLSTSYAYRLKTVYGITPEDYNRMYHRQKGLCRICGEEPRRIQGGKSVRFHVDHCHTTGKIRGLLCYQCNVGLGYFRDNPELLKKAVTYLEESRPAVLRVRR